MSAPSESPLMRERARARRLATGIVATSLGIGGLLLVVLAIVMIVRGGAALVLLAIVVGILGVALGAAGFFFQLVPLRLDELEAQKREYDRRTRDER